jgi:hypothetical protein
MKLSCNAGISIGDFRADSLIDKLIAVAAPLR